MKAGEDRRLTPLEGMDVIITMLQKTQPRKADSAFRFLLWGALISLASFSYFVLKPYSSWYFLPFPVLVFFGVIVTIAEERKKAVSCIQSHLQFFLNRMWLVLGIFFLVVVFINVSQGQVPFTYTILLASIGTLVSGVVIGFRPLIVSGAMLLGAGIASVYVPEVYKVVVHGVAIGAGYMIPGYLLKMRNP